MRIYESLGAGEVTFGLRSGGWRRSEEGMDGGRRIPAAGIACAKPLGRKRLRSFRDHS